MRATSWSASSAGVHANGFTLVRRVLEEEDYAGDDLLAPTRLYLDEVRALDARGLAHVTGGGIENNLARVLRDGLRAEIDWESWERLPVFHWLARHVEEHELGASSTSGSATAPSSPRRMAAK